VTATLVHPTAIVEAGVEVGRGTQVWDAVHIRGPGTKIGADCIIGEKTYVAYGVIIGDRVKLNAFVYVCTGVTIEDGVMAGAGVIFTNDRYPRATTADLSSPLPSTPDSETCRTVVHRGATLGAGARIGPGLDIGDFALVGMGAVVTKAVPAFHMVVGNPAKLISIACRCGRPILRADTGYLPDCVSVTCSVCGRRYGSRSGRVTELDGPT
jgi:UDP-2-acetamido-3-amino-2,3-dideoxy-glucuronate N-acetyltransferase